MAACDACHVENSETVITFLNMIKSHLIQIIIIPPRKIYITLRNQHFMS